MTPEPILLATRSEGKRRELLPIFAAAGLTIVDLEAAGLPELAEEADVERYDTFEQNALAKARYFHHRSGMAVIAEDSGLEVRALGGAPGVRSKRWSERSDLAGQALDDANNAKLISALAQVSDRAARYVCEAVFRDSAREVVASGTVTGEILHTPRGHGGFGYDPYFFSPELGCTFGEADRDAKERVSHRGRAMRALLAQLARQE